MSLLGNLRDLFSEALGPDDASDDRAARVTVAALLTLVAQADGRVLGVEERGLAVLLQSYFRLSEADAARIIVRAADIGSGFDSITALADRILQDIPFEERPALLILAYRVAAIDGQVHEFEDDLIWRIGRLLGMSDGQIVELKIEALKNLSPGEAHDRT
ncbi:TerB family tellurite resistance protein [Microvirga flavescens]|uniref:tellurite resistance TerB family protein n=1 Tax=Microvirga flavescens TaxID=2249811 RepID=UPI0013005A2C|nr:TerB family tellurite resistance protein [Microvirga flavescens]